MQALLFPAFDFVAKSRVAQIILGIGVFYGLLKARDAMRDRHTKARVERRIEKQSRKVQARIKQDNETKSIQVERARESAPRGVAHSDSVPEHLSGVLFGD